MSIAKYRKALIAAGIAGLGSLGVALVDEQITLVEWIAAASVTLAALGGTYAVPNKASATVRDGYLPPSL